VDSKPKAIIKDRDVVSISKQEFIEGAAFPADIFTRISEDKYVLLAHQGDKANFAELSVNRAIDIVFVLRDEYRKCVGQNLTVAGIVVAQKGVSTGKKAEFIAKAAESVFKELEHLGISPESIEHARHVSHNIKLLVESNSDLLDVMSILSSLPGNQMHRSIAVSAVAVMIGQKMGWTVSATLEKLAMGALLRDVGLKELPKELIEKPRHELTQDERLIYETHPFRGAEILRSMPSASDELISIVYEHHETSNGQGYPRRLRDVRLNPLAKVVSLADTFCELTIQNPNNPKTRSPNDAIAYLETTMGQPFNRQAFQALKQLAATVSPEVLKRAK
jgi:HD-GYP domain-containing protein (c-di-GMP phosphodiesterase class II)